MGCQAIKINSQADLRSLAREEAEGIPAAFDELVELIEEDVVRTALFLTRHLQDAEDVAQEVYVRLLRNQKNLSQISNLRGWIHTITVNAARDHLRRRKLWEPLEKVRSWIRPRDSAESHQFQGRLRQALSELSFSQRSVFVLQELHDMSTREVATVLGCSEVTVRGHLMAARKRLRIHLGELRS